MDPWFGAWNASAGTAVGVRVAAAGLRLQAARAAESAATTRELQAFHDFFWVYLLGWAVQSRLSQWLAWLIFAKSTGQEWLDASVLNLVFLTSSALWSLAFIRGFWNMRLRTHRANVWTVFGVSCIVPLVNLLTFFWLLQFALFTLIPLFMLNVTGLAWAWIVGSRRWQALQQQSLVAVASVGSGPRQTPPSLAGLKAMQIVGIAVVLFFFLAFLLVCAAYLWFAVTSQKLPHG